jgi:hypothetical protein
MERALFGHFSKTSANIGVAAPRGPNRPTPAGFLHHSRWLLARAAYYQTIKEFERLQPRYFSK